MPSECRDAITSPTLLQKDESQALGAFLKDILKCDVSQEGKELWELQIRTKKNQSRVGQYNSLRMGLELKLALKLSHEFGIEIETILTREFKTTLPAYFIKEKQLSNWNSPH